MTPELGFVLLLASAGFMLLVTLYFYNTLGGDK